MKKSFLVISILALVFGAASCRKVVSEIPEKYKAVEQLQLDGSASVEFSAAGGNQYVKVVGNVGTISVESSSNWVITEVEGQNIILSAGSNETLNIRYATLTITSASGKARTMQVKQFGVDNSYLWEDTYEVPASGQELLLHFLPTMETVRLQVTGREWITAEMDYTSIKLTIAKNTKDEERTGTITWQAGEDVRSFNIVQASASGDDSGDDPGDDPGDFVASYEDWVGTWTVGGRTLSFAESEDYPGEVLVMTDSGYGDLADYFHPLVVFDAQSGDIVFVCQKVFEYDIEEYYFIGVDGNNLRFGDEEQSILAAGKMTSAGKAQIVPVSYTDTQGNTVSASGLTVLVYQTEDTADYDAGWYGLQGVEELAIPANISKTGTSSVSSVKTTGSQLPVFKRSFVRFNR